MNKQQIINEVCRRTGAPAQDVERLLPWVSYRLEEAVTYFATYTNYKPS